MAATQGYLYSRMAMGWSCYAQRKKPVLRQWFNWRLPPPQSVSSHRLSSAFHTNTPVVETRNDESRERCPLGRSAEKGYLCEFCFRGWTAAGGKNFVYLSSLFQGLAPHHLIFWPSRWFRVVNHGCCRRASFGFSKVICSKRILTLILCVVYPAY